MSALDANRTRTSSSLPASFTPDTSSRIGMPSLMKLPLSAPRWIWPSGWNPRVQPSSRQCWLSMPAWPAGLVKSSWAHWPPAARVDATPSRSRPASGTSASNVRNPGSGCASGSRQASGGKTSSSAACRLPSRSRASRTAPRGTPKYCLSFRFMPSGQCSGATSGISSRHIDTTNPQVSPVPAGSAASPDTPQPAASAAAPSTAIAAALRIVMRAPPTPAASSRSGARRKRPPAGPSPAAWSAPRAPSIPRPRARGRPAAPGRRRGPRA